MDNMLKAGVMVFQFKIQLKDITRPPVWRTVTVPAQFSFAKLHRVIQAAFGWQNAHLYQFSPQGFGSAPVISVPYPNQDLWEDTSVQLLNAAKTKLSDIFTQEKQHYTYIYDFGDNWVHVITLEKITDATAQAATCTGGKGACPPEDCGGPWGYESLKEVLADPKHPEHADMKEWLGLTADAPWEAARFDLALAQKAVSRTK
jgi:hypothetical protein